MMKKILFFVLLAGAYWHWNGGQFPFTNQPLALDATGKPTTWIFTYKECGAPCKDAVQELKNRHVAFEEKSISQYGQDAPDYKLWQAHKTSDTFPLIVAGNNSTSGYYIPAMATLLGKTFGDSYLTTTEKRYFKKHFNADGSPRIVVYEASWCGYCAKLKKELIARNIDFTGVDVEKSGEEQLLKTTMGINGYPATWVGYTRAQNGSDLNTIMALLTKE